MFGLDAAQTYWTECGWLLAPCRNGTVPLAWHGRDRMRRWRTAMRQRLPWDAVETAG